MLICLQLIVSRSNQFSQLFILRTLNKMSISWDQEKILLKVFIKKVSIPLKFPCSLKATVSSDCNSSISEIHQLKNGVAEFNESIQIKDHVNYNRSKCVIDDKKIAITFQILLNNGPTNAGDIIFNLAGKECNRNYQCIKYIEKSPQKNSTATFTYSVEIIPKNEKKITMNKKAYPNNHQRVIKSIKETYSPFNTRQSFKNESEGYGEITKSPLSPRSIIQYQSIEKPNPIKSAIKQPQLQKLKYAQQLSRNLNASKSVNKKNQIEPPKILVNRISKEKRNGSNELKPFRSLTKKVQQRIINQQSSQLIQSSIQRPKLQRVKSFQNLQNQERATKIRHALSDRNYQSRNSINIQSSKEVIQQTVEIVKLKDRLKQSERSSKSIQKKLKKTIQENQKKTFKILQLESKNSELEHNLKIKQDRIKILEKKFKNVVDEQEETNNYLKTQKAQADHKVTILKEQIIKAEQKCKIFDQQRDNAIKDLNQALNKLEKSEKKCQHMMQEKDKNLNQQKNKFVKLIDAKQSQISKYETECQSLKQSLQQLASEKCCLMEQISELQFSLGYQKEQCQQLSQKLKKQSNLSLSYESQMEALKVDESTRLTLKLKIAETRSHQVTINQKLIKNEKANQLLQEQLDQAAKRIIKLTKQNDSLQQCIITQKKNIASFKEQEYNKSKEIQILTNYKNTTIIKMKQLKEKLEWQKRHTSELQRCYQLQMEEFQRNYQAKSEEFNDLNWQFSRAQNKVEQLTSLIQSQSDQIVRLSQQIFQKSQKYRHLQDQMLTLSLQYNQMCSNHKDTQKKCDELALKLQTISYQINNSKSRIAELEKQLEEQRKAIKQIILSNKERSTYSQMKIRQQQKQIESKDKVVQQLKINIINQDQEIQSIRNKYLKVQNELQFVNENSDQMKIELESMALIKKELRSKDKQFDKYIQQIEKLKSKHKQELDKMTKQVFQKQAIFQRYKQSTDLNLVAFFTNLIKQEQHQWKYIKTQDQYTKNNQKCLIYPYQQVSNLQVTYINNRTKNIQNARIYFQNIRKQNERLHDEIQKSRTNVQQLKSDYQNQINALQVNILKINAQAQAQKQTQSEVATRLQDQIISKIKQIQSIKQQLMQKNQNYNELQSNLINILAVSEELKQEKYIIEKTFSEHRQSCLKKQLIIFRTQTTQEDYLCELSRLRKVIQESQSNLKEAIAKMHQKNELLKKSQNELVCLKFSHGRLQEQLSVENLEIRQLQSTIRAYDGQLKEKNQQILIYSKKCEQLQNSIGSMKSLNKQLKDKYENLSSESNQAFDINKQKQYIPEIQAKHAEHFNKLKFKIECQKVEIDKMKKQGKALSETNISQSSEIQLKSFVIRQLQDNLHIDQTAKKQLQEEIDRKKVEIRVLNENLQIEKQKSSDLQEILENAECDKAQMSYQIEKFSSLIKRLQTDQLEQIQLKETLSNLERQNNKLKSEKIESQQFYEGQIIELKSLMRDIKKNENQKSKRDQQLKQKIKSLENLLETQQPDLAFARISMKQQFEKEKRLLSTKIDKLQEENMILNDQTAVLKQQLKKESAVRIQTAQQFNQERSSKELLIKQQIIDIQKLKYKINELEVDSIFFQKEKRSKA